MIPYCIVSEQKHKLFPRILLCPFCDLAVKNNTLVLGPRNIHFIEQLFLHGFPIAIYCQNSHIDIFSIFVSHKCNSCNCYKYEVQHKRKIVYIFCCIKEGCKLQASFYLTLPVFMGPGSVPKPMSKVKEHVTVSNQNEPRGHEH